ncbi:MULTISPECIES: 5'-nucleotidase C-terminal domain-containing protein [Pontibacillus]|uniref:5'-nucleotidase C-terminal domain-containing protein n=1 Tax=Pontibacillus chungwhensis TaxID=265426 RepID=A0ABY8V455_9BACI|nr:MULTISPECIES: 5'-nucleotidase C-terminal domain-containing protein [Pontibacillus]MCD5324333.1 5'-nucleotidase C-terminal domain-containing protein [Pontibacillus sp. HN14]WIF99369.1 5'-nucleotidase C-terminal domain-containing protein [Pontibacillus chungwhensis]
MGKSHKIVASLAATTAAVAAMAAPVSADAQDFSDVSERYTDAVNFLLEMEATNGYSETEFGTQMAIKRVDAAVLLANVLKLDTEDVEPSGFTDVPDRAEGAVSALKAAGITNGKSETMFGSKDEITRGELAIWIEEGFGLKGVKQLPFTDVSDRYEDAVEALLANDVTQGVSKDAFGTDQMAKRGDYAIFLKRAFDVMDEQDGKFELSLMHTNDTHGHIENIAKKKTAIDAYRDDNPEALLLDAGDVFSGTLYFQEFLGQADLEFMNKLDYDAMTFGNHEFDLGKSENGHQALADFVKNADFPFVSANVDFSEDELFDGLQHEDEIASTPEDGEIYGGIVAEVDGEQVGIFGLTTVETPDISSPVDVKFEDYVAEAEKMVQSFKDRGINKVIALTHLGYNDNIDYDNDVALAEAVEGIDVIVGGHSHTELMPTVIGDEEPTVLVQSGEYSDNLGTLEVEFDENGVVKNYAGELIELEGVEEDAWFASKLKPYTEQVNEIKNEEIGVSTDVMLNGERASVRTGETNLGNLIADGMLAKAKSVNPDTQIAVTNGGGIRASIDEGPITLGEVLTVMPFGNALGIMTLSGAELEEALEHSVAMAPEKSGAFLHVAGMKFEYDSSKPAGERVGEIQVKTDDGFVSLEADTEYKVASNLFTIQGGDGYTTFEKAYEENRVSEPGFMDYEIFVDYLQSKGDTIAPETEGRITDTSGQ